jgi:integrase
MARKDGKDRGILQRKGREGWWVRLYVSGRERWFRCDTKSQARALYGRLKADIREGKFFPEKFAPRKDITLRAWILRCLDGSTNRGIKNERRYGRRWSLLLGKRLLDQISTEDLRLVQAKMNARRSKLQTRKKEKVHAWSNGTINRHFAFLRHVLMLAVKDGKLVRNPVSGIKFLPEERRTRFLTEGQLTKLEKVMPVQYWKLVAFAIETGLRREEQFRLRWDQVDLESGIVTIPLPKGGKTRHVPLSDGAQAILRSLDSFIRSPWVFPSPKNPLHSWNPQSFVNHVFSPVLANAGIQGVCWHTLRHTAASRRVMAGVDLVSVKEILGHRDIQTTLRYAHLSPGHLRDAVNRGSLTGTVTKTVTKVIQEVAGGLGIEPR